MTHEAFSSLMLAYQPLVRRSASKLAWGLHDAEDLAQETYLRALLGRRKFQLCEGRGMRRWLLRIMRNFQLSFNRRHRPEACNERLQAIPIWGQPVDFAAAAEIHEAISKLPEPFRETMVLRAEGWEYHEIAEKLRLRMGTVMSRLHRGRLLLKRLV